MTDTTAIEAVKFYTSLETVLDFDNDLSDEEKRELVDMAVDKEL